MKAEKIHLLQRASKILFLKFILITLSIAAFGQSDLKSLLNLAETNYPGILARKEKAEAAKAQVSLGKNTILPSIDAAWQANYSTYNNISGMSYPGILVPISGPPSEKNIYEAVPGSAAGLIFRWSPVTFGQRSASVEYSQKSYEQQIAGIEDEILKVKFRVASKYLEIASTRELIKVYQKNIERSEFDLKQASVLAGSGIRPGTDSLKFKGELSKTRTALFALENLQQSQLQELTELLASDHIPDVEINEFFFQNLPSFLLGHTNEPGMESDSGSSANPSLKIARYEVEAGKAQLKQIDRSWAPRLEFWGTTYARGSSIHTDGSVNISDGWMFSRYNYGVGVQLVFPLLDLANYKYRHLKNQALLRVAEQNFNETQNTLHKAENLALNDLSTSLKIAHEIPNEYFANESAFKSMQTRYNAGLISYTELIQAQYDLLDSEARLKNAFISSWEALLRLAVIRGDLTIFLNQMQKGS